MCGDLEVENHEMLALEFSSAIEPLRRKNIWEGVFEVQVRSIIISIIDR